MTTIKKLKIKVPEWLLPAGLLLSITFLVFLPALSAYFVCWDDRVYIFENSTLAPFDHIWDWSAVKAIFTSNIGGNYDPLPIFTFAIEKYFFAPDVLASPFIFHFDNLLLHLACTLCAYFLFMKMGLKRWGAFFGALLFGIHPMRVESVAWITERKDVLYGLFYLLALLSYIKYIKTDGKRTLWYGTVIIFSVAACFSKGQAAFLPLSMVTLDIYFKRKWYAPKVLLVEKLPWWLLSLMFGCINLYFSRKEGIINAAAVYKGYSILGKLAMGVYSYAIYLVKFIYPYRLTCYYEYPAKVPLVAYACLVVVPLVFVMLLRKQWKNKAIVFGVAFFTFNILFMLQVVAVGYGFLADRFTYVAYVGLFFLVAVAYETIFEKLTSYRYLLLGAICAYCTLLSVRAYQQCKVWRNTISLWDNFNKTDRNSAFGYFQLGTFFVNEENHKWPDLYVTYSDSEMVKLANNNLDTALQKDTARKVITENTPKIYMELAVVNSLANRQDIAIVDFTRVIAMHPDKPEVALASRAWAYTLNNKIDSSILDYEQYLKLDTTSDLVYARYGVCEGYERNYAKGLYLMNKAIKINSGDPSYYVMRARLYQKLNMRDSMFADIQKVQQMGAGVPNDLLR